MFWIPKREKTIDTNNVQLLQCSFLSTTTWNKVSKTLKITYCCFHVQ